jgi:hypothetical protein
MGIFVSRRKQITLAKSRDILYFAFPADFFDRNNLDELVKSRKASSVVIPVKTGIQEFRDVLDSRRSLSPRRRGRE